MAISSAARDAKKTPVQLVRAVQSEIGADALAHWCVALLTREATYDDPGYPPLTKLAGAHAASELQIGNLDERGSDYWPRVWGARGLLHGWQPALAGEATPAIVAALADDAWRVREMSAKVVRRWEIAEAADSLAELVADETPRVRAAALRALAVVGESEHTDAIRSALDDEERIVRTAAEAALDRLDERLDRSAERRSRAPRTSGSKKLARKPAPARATPPPPMPTRQRARTPFTADDLAAVLASALDALRPAVDLDWGAPAGDLAWTCAKTCAHVADDLVAFAAQLAARVPSGYAPFLTSPRRRTAPAGLLTNLEAGGALLVLAARAALPDARGFHGWGMADAEGFAALGAAEVIVHTYDIASGLGVSYAPGPDLCHALLDRLGRDLDLTDSDLANADSVEVLLWASGRRDLPGRPRRTRWRWWPAPEGE